MSARNFSMRAAASSIRASSVSVNFMAAGNGALQDSQAVKRRLKTANPQTGHLNLDGLAIDESCRHAASESLRRRSVPERDRSRVGVPVPLKI